MPPTVSILNPRAGGIVSGSFKVQVQAWDAAAEVTAVDVSTDGGISYVYSATKNPNYSPGTGSAIWEATLALAPGSYTLKARAISSSGEGLYRSVAITVAAAGVGDGTLLVRDNSSTLCLDCHALATHSSQYTSTKYGTWAVVCRECHTPHQTRNLGLIRETITTPNSGSKSVAFATTTGDSASSTPSTSSYVNSDQTGPCQVCHTQTQGAGGVARWRNTGNADSHYTAASGTQRCTNCHLHSAGFAPAGGGAHTTHVSGPQLSLACAECHNTASIPQFRDGAASKAATTVCNACHSLDGVSLAKQYWDSPGSSAGAAGSWAVVVGERSYCGSCHDLTPGNSKGDGTGRAAVNILGDDSTYGVYITGHGKTTGAYAKLSWQDALAGGNPAANRRCSDCHNLATPHFNTAAKRLKAGFENDQNNSNCKQCHDPGTTAAADPQFYTTYAAYQASAHNSKKCTACHEVHGSTGPYGGMTRGSKETLCYQCHSAGGGVANNALSNRAGYVSATNVRDAFTGKSVKHPLGKDFSLDGNATVYTLECTSCHNVHIVTGRYWQADQNKSPITRFASNLAVWGVSAGQKMDDYAGSGTYRTPFNDVFTGAQLPDYATFCLECHAGSLTSPSNPNPLQPTHGLVNWNSDPHGRLSADAPHGSHNGHALQGGDTHPCPNWTSCGQAKGWDGDVCVGSQADCWPVRSRSIGDVLFQREPYSHSDRVKGRNFVLACIDCHEAHGSNRGSFIRERLNTTNTGACGTGSNGANCTDAGDWGSYCNICHYHYSPQHDGMGCGSASCHAGNHSNGTWWNSTNNPHGMEKGGSGGGSRSLSAHDSGLVLWMAFENNVRDSADWRLHGKWKVEGGTGSFAPGKSGQAVVLDGAHTIQVATQDATWSTCEGGDCGTGHPPNWGGGGWKYTHMKYNTTLEAWVYPTDDAGTEYTIFSKHTGYGNGDYLFALRKISGSLRAAFLGQVDNNGGAQGGRAGVRGAYSAVSIPLNRWTHVAATFDTNGPDRNPADPAAGRIRIYVNGEDVTASSSTGEYLQPGAGETSIFAFPENSGWNEGVCSGNWCAAEFSVGGFHEWQNGFKGMMDEAKVWNVTKDAAYFASYDSQAGPYISSVEGATGSNLLTVRFSEGVYTDPGGSGALTSADFILTDTDNGRVITQVTHTAGSSTAVLTLDSALDETGDFGVDTLAAASDAIFDDQNNAADTTPVTLTTTPSCPTGTVTLGLNEPPGSAYVLDDQQLLSGKVFGSGTLTGGEYSGGGDGSGRYILFSNNDSCLQASTSLTIQARIQPAGLAGTDTFIRRILARDGGGNYQMSVWRNNAWSSGTYNAPSGEVSIALWVNPADAHGGNAWKPVLTNYTGAKTGSENDCPIVSDHWYLIKAVWNTNKPGGTPGQVFQPADIYLEDQGTDGLGAGRNWSGLLNCTDTDESLKPDAAKFYTGDVITRADGSFAIGANRSNPANNLFNGLIDWITVQDAVE